MIHLNAYIRFLTFNKGNYTVLHELCKSNRIEFVQLLINLDNIDVNIQDSFLQTPLHVAAFHHFNDLVEILIRSQKCNYDIVDKCGVYIIFIYELYSFIDIYYKLITKNNYFRNFNIFKLRENNWSTNFFFAVGSCSRNHEHQSF